MSSHLAEPSHVAERSRIAEQGHLAGASQLAAPEQRDAGQPLDGRAARRQRNIDAVLDVVIELFAEESMFPTIEQVATRSGLSLRSLYRYFADPGELLEAAIERTSRLGRELSHIHTIGEGPLDKRIDEFVAMRLRLHDSIGAVHRGGVVNAARHQRIRDQMALDRDAMRHQFEIQFAPELALRKGPERDALVSAGDLMTQLESIDFLRRHRRLGVAEAQECISTALRLMLR